MGKEFIEYESENGRMPVRASQLCFALTEYAKDYIKEEHKLIQDVDVKVRDAVLVDAINYLGLQGCCDFALYTSDLYESHREIDYVDPQILLTAIVNHYPYYMFNEDISESVLRNKHMNKCSEPFNSGDGILVLVDFINYVTKKNEYERIFTTRELFEKYQSANHRIELNELREFLELAGKYNQKLERGENIDHIFKSMASKHNLERVDEDGTYHYTELIRNRVGQSEMYSWDAKKVDSEIFAMAYAYAKREDKRKTPETAVINKKILEMKKRD